MDETFIINQAKEAISFVSQDFASDLLESKYITQF